MIASVDHGFVLLANPKCASTALESAFGHVAEFTVSKKPHWKHLSYRQYREIFGDYFERNGCDVFAVVRDPFDLLCSWWRYRQRPKILDPAHPRHANRTSEVSFREWLHEWGSHNPPPRARVGGQKETLCDHDGAPGEIRFYRYEDLDGLVAELNRRIGGDVTLARSNESPQIAVDATTDDAWPIARFREEWAFYEAVLERAGAA